jgi:hypothetical protein
MVTDGTIISELPPRKEEARPIQGAMARPNKRLVVALRGAYLNFFPFMDKFRFWQGIIYFSLHEKGKTIADPVFR